MASFIESGFGKGLLIDFNYDTEPLPGKFPLPGVGPFSLLEETKMIADFFQPVLMCTNRAMNKLITTRFVSDISKQLLERRACGKSFFTTELTILFDIP